MADKVPVIQKFVGSIRVFLTMLEDRVTLAVPTPEQLIIREETQQKYMAAVELYRYLSKTAKLSFVAGILCIALPMLTILNQAVAFGIGILGTIIFLAFYGINRETQEYLKGKYGL